MPIGESSNRSELVTKFFDAKFTERLCVISKDVATVAIPRLGCVFSLICAKEIIDASEENFLLDMKELNDPTWSNNELAYMHYGGNQSLLKYSFESNLDIHSLKKELPKYANYMKKLW